MADHNDEDDLKRVVGYFEEHEQSSITSRYMSERDRDYYDNIQWTDEELAALERRSQPAITINRIKPKVDFLLGLERQNRTDPKALPRTPVHEEAATAATDAIRFVVDNTEFDYTSSEVFENELVEGTGGAEVLVKKIKEGFEVDIKYYPWDRLFWDPRSRRRDFRDAKFKGSVVWMDMEDALDMATQSMSEDKAKSVLSTTQESYDDTFEDTPRSLWYDKERKRVRIATIWWMKNGVWMWAKFTKNGFIKGPFKSPFLDEDGMPECGLEMQSAFVDRDGNRYGWVRPMIDTQDEINKRRSKSLHLLSVRQFRYEKGAVDDPNRTKDELAKPDGAIETNPNFEFELLGTNDLAQGQLALLQEAKAEIDNVAANPNTDDGKVRSGRAELARQQAGTMELGPIFDGHRHFKKRIYRQVWNRIKQFWDAERWIRVTDDENNLKWVGLNRPVTVEEKLTEDLSKLPPEQVNDPAFQQALAQIKDDPRMKEQVETQNPIAELDMDIIIEDAPDYPTAQQEQFDNLISVLQTGSNLPLSDPRWQLIIMSSQLRNKKAILDFLKSSSQNPEQAQQQKEAFDLEKQGKMADIDKTRADATKKMSEAVKTQIESGVR
jgi:hypothetical protein